MSKGKYEPVVVLQPRPKVLGRNNRSPRSWENIIAPQRAKAEKSTPGYDLLNYVAEGDLIFHWWRKPSNPENRGFYGYSEVVGKLQEGVIPWKSRGRYAESEVSGPKPAKYWNLANFHEFSRPYLIGELNTKKDEIFQLIEDLENQYGKPIYFPFCKREGKVAANQTYFAKLPLELVELLNISVNLPPLVPQLTAKRSQQTRSPKTEKNGSYSRQMDPEKRAAVEKHAESEVKAYLENLGYKVEKFGKPFDFLAIKENESVKVEVKGKQDYAVTVEVTINEVEVAKNLDGDFRTLLAVVDGIEVSNQGGDWKANGGRMRTWWDMPFDEESLFPTRFQYTLPID